MCSTYFSPTSNVSCCETNNCNSVNLAAKVKSCFVGTFNASMRTINQTLCESPKNQFCVTKRDTFNNDNFYCSDSCIEANTKETLTKCCQTENCNVPEQLSCITSQSNPIYFKDFLPKSVNCSFNQIFCLVIQKL